MGGEEGREGGERRKWIRWELSRERRRMEARNGEGRGRAKEGEFGQRRSQGKERRAGKKGREECDTQEAGRRVVRERKDGRGKEDAHYKNFFPP
jgi:hypothetical protein